MDDVKQVPMANDANPDNSAAEPTTSSDATKIPVSVVSRPTEVADKEPTPQEELEQQLAANDIAPASPMDESSDGPSSEVSESSTMSDQSPSADQPEPAQKGAGLDLSSLDENDAKDLGMPLPAASPATASPEGAMSSKPKVKHSKMTAVIVAVLVALALIGGAAYAYVTNNKKTKTTQATPAPAVTTQKPASTVKATDIDTTTSALDASLKKVDDTNNFAAADLSDATLGL